MLSFHVYTKCNSVKNVNWDFVRELCLNRDCELYLQLDANETAFLIEFFCVLLIGNYYAFCIYCNSCYFVFISSLCLIMFFKQIIIGISIVLLKMVA